MNVADLRSTLSKVMKAVLMKSMLTGDHLMTCSYFLQKNKLTACQGLSWACFLLHVLGHHLVLDAVVTLMTFVELMSMMLKLMNILLITLMILYLLVGQMAFWL